MGSGELEPFTGEDSSVDLDLVAASLRADTTDLHTFLEVIAAKLEDAMPSSVTVKRVKQGFRGPKVVQEIAVDAGGERLELHRRGTAIDSVRAKISGGIVLKREALGIDEWLNALARILGTEAERSQQTRQALARLLDTP